MSYLGDSISLASLLVDVVSAIALSVADPLIAKAADHAKHLVVGAAVEAVGAHHVAAHLVGSIIAVIIAVADKVAVLAVLAGADDLGALQGGGGGDGDGEEEEEKKRRGETLF